LLYTVEGVLGFTLVASLLGLLGVFATHIFDIYNCRMMVHLSWIVFGFSYLGVILLTFLFVPGGSVGYQTCNYFGKALTNQT
jgi:cytochrome c biogenesis protein CcdA